MQWHKIDKQVDRINEDNLEVDLKFSIGRFTQWFISNIFGRSLSYLVGWTGDIAKMLRCTTAGILKVAITGSGFEFYEVFTGTSVDAYVNIFSSGAKYSRVDIWFSTNAMTIKFFHDTTTFGDDSAWIAGDFYSFDCVVAQLAIKSTVGGVHGTYKVIVWR